MPFRVPALFRRARGADDRRSGAKTDAASKPPSKKISHHAAAAGPVGVGRPAGPNDSSADEEEDVADESARGGKKSFHREKEMKKKSGAVAPHQSRRASLPLDDKGASKQRHASDSTKGATAKPRRNEGSGKKKATADGARLTAAAPVSAGTGADATTGVLAEEEEEEEEEEAPDVGPEGASAVTKSGVQYAPQVSARKPRPVLQVGKPGAGKSSGPHTGHAVAPAQGSASAADEEEEEVAEEEDEPPLGGPVHQRRRTGHFRPSELHLMQFRSCWSTYVGRPLLK